MPILTRRPWTSQPRGVDRVALDNPLTAGLTLLWSATSPLVDVRGRQIGPSAGTWAPSYSAAGVGYRGSNNGSQRVDFTPPPPSANSTSYTVFAYVNDDAGSGVNRNPIDCDNTTRVFQLRFTANDGVELITFDTFGTPFFATSSAITWSPRVGLLLGRVANNQLSVWWQGRQMGTGSATGTQNVANGNKLTIAGSPNNNQGFLGQVFLAGHFNRGLSDGEIQSLSTNPWQLFEAPRRRLWVGPAAAGGATNVSATPGAAAWAGVASTVTQGAINATTGASAWSGITASIPAQAISATVGAAAWAGVASTIDNGATVAATPGTFAWSGVTHSVSAQSVAATVGAYAWVGVQSTVAVQAISAAPGVISWAGLQSQIQTLTNIDALPGSLVWAGVQSQIVISGDTGAAAAPMPALGSGDISEHFVNDYGGNPYSSGGLNISSRIARTAGGDTPTPRAPVARTKAKTVRSIAFPAIKKDTPPKPPKAAQAAASLPVTDPDALAMQLAQVRQDVDRLAQQVAVQAQQIQLLQAQVPPQLLRSKPAAMKLHRSTDK